MRILSWQTRAVGGKKLYWDLRARATLPKSLLQEKLIEQTNQNLAWKKVGDLCTDTWLSWSRRALKICYLAGERPVGSDKGASTLAKLGVFWASNVMNKNLAQALAAQHNTLSAESYQLLRRLEMRHGAAVLTTDYTKLLRLLKVVNASVLVTKHSWSGDNCFQHIVKAMHLALDRGHADPGFWKVTVIDPANQKPGWCHVVFARVRFVLWVQSLLSHMSENKAKKEMQDIVADFVDPEVFQR